MSWSAKYWPPCRRVEEVEAHEVAKALPYGESFLFIDRADLSGRPDTVVTEKTYLLSEPLIAAHFRAGPKVVPGVVLIEQICQSALLLALGTGRLPPGGGCFSAASRPA
jgi:3-hydroxymyristoyl/3-hydroxydecanoyl-(acyl carrier protein) dehydratase